MKTQPLSETRSAWTAALQRHFVQVPGNWTSLIANSKSQIANPNMSQVIRHTSFYLQPISVHGAGTVRHGAAVSFSIAQCRHNVSARDGGIPASRMRFGAVRPGHRTLPNLPLDALFTSSIHGAFNQHTSDSPGGRRSPDHWRPAIIPQTGNGGRSDFSSNLPEIILSRSKKQKLPNEPILENP
jgi:hypothetical protein